MGTVYREDRGAIRRRPKRTDEGYILAEGVAARPGVYTYTRADGTTFRELVDADVLAASAAGLARKPVTVLHPDRMVTPSTVREDMAGMTGERVLVDDGYIVVTTTITRDDGIRRIERDGWRELSCGYYADVDETPGVWTDADGVLHAYDCRQTGRKYNHLALVPRGRHGSEASLRIDSLEGAAVMADAAPPTPHEGAMLKFRIDGTQYQTDDADLVADVTRITTERDDAAAKLADATAATQTAQGELAATRAKLDEAEAKLAERGDGADAEKVQAAVDARLDALAVAAAVGLDVTEARKLDDVGLKRAIVAKAAPKLDGVAEAEGAVLDGMYRATVASVSRTDGLAKLAEAFRPAKREDGGDHGNDDFATRMDRAEAGFMAQLGPKRPAA